MLIVTKTMEAFADERTKAAAINILKPGDVPMESLIRLRGTFPPGKFIAMLCDEVGSLLATAVTNAAGHVVTTTMVGEVDEYKVTNNDYIVIDRAELDSAARQPSRYDLFQPIAEPKVGVKAVEPEATAEVKVEVQPIEFDVPIPESLLIYGDKTATISGESK